MTLYTYMQVYATLRFKNIFYIAHDKNRITPIYQFESKVKQVHILRM